MTTGVPLAAPGRVGPDEAEAVRRAIARVVESGVYVDGDEVNQFERAFADSIGAGFQCVAVASGLDALTLSLRALGLPAGSVALVPVNDGGFAAKAATDADLVVRPIDCGPDGNVGLSEVAAVCDDRVAVAIVTHLHGLVADAGPIGAWCRERGIRVVEDCAQAHGARGIAEHGDLSAFSFYPTKNLGAFGDAGAVVTRDVELAHRISRLRQYGWGARFSIELPGGRNSRMDALQAAVLGARLPHLAEGVARRRSIVDRYRGSAGGAEVLGRDGEGFVAHHAVLLTEERDALAALLDARGISHGIHYPYLVTEMPGLDVEAGREHPNADRLRRRMISLPCFAGMHDDEVQRVCDVLAAWNRAGG